MVQFMDMLHFNKKCDSHFSKELVSERERVGGHWGRDGMAGRVSVRPVKYLLTLPSLASPVHKAFGHCPGDPRPCPSPGWKPLVQSPVPLVGREPFAGVRVARQRQGQALFCHLLCVQWKLKVHVCSICEQKGEKPTCFAFRNILLI